mmetsp:Transcript_77704/g.126035  ORF Transcript_77704/g.126035 Transcript_77704/m.126035 type:complete len:213 (-) Transcript_77704:164-802(-)|eukprot:CAMPEP_0179423020 /NCGR_PEP_ID=MMETSP0799-20121207/10769_1 /TAXON_ID=46947 /ORGANISM="Geminigera cryophila, Strain CCMP2564" /LENGTH=212 /DNA_ID=CAMNT_0021197251 /DNA_START=135 /DNA_END=773 /DNA_ORIENTATION=-
MLRFLAMVMVVGVVKVAGDERADTALDACGMPRAYGPTSHCFNDRTHHTCCLLGPEARRYADASGNPIGTASSKAFKAKQGVAPTDEELTPWCTCFGSLVCSYYAEKFQDGTHIKFIYQPGTNPPMGAFDIPANKSCEAKAREHFKVQAHGTPGVTSPNGVSAECSDYDVQNHIKLVSLAILDGPDRVGGAGAAGSQAEETCSGENCAKTTR